MRAVDVWKERGRANTVAAKVGALEQRRRELAQPGRTPERGTAIVQAMVKLGDGCLCDLELLVAGRGTGVLIADAVSHGAQFEVGAVVYFERRHDASVEIVGGGGGGAAGTQTTIDGALIWPTGWSILGT